MINPSEQRITEIIELLEEMKLFTDEEINGIEDYLGENETEAALEKLQPRDLSKISAAISNEVSALFVSLTGKGKKELATRLANVLFAAGHSTCHPMFPMSLFNYHKNEFFMEPIAKTVIYVNKIALSQYTINSYTIENLIKMSYDNADPKQGALPNLKQAMEYQRDGKDDGRLLLLVAYFMKKYNKPNNTALVDAEDKELLERYENICLNSVRSFYQARHLTNKEIDSMIQAVMEDKTGETLLALIKKKNYKRGWLPSSLHILTVASFVNYQLSHILKNVLMLCLGANMESALDIMDGFHAWDDMLHSGNLDLISGLDENRFFRWAISKRKVPLAEALFDRNRQAFIEYMDSADLNSYNWMNVILKGKDPDYFQERASNEISRQQVKVIEIFIKGMSSAKKTVRNYLEGRAEIDDLIAVEDKLSLHGFREYENALHGYQKVYGYDKFSSRCEIVITMCRRLNCYYLSGNNELERHSQIRRFFTAVDSEKLSIRHQANGLSDLLESCYYDDQWKKVIFDAGIEVFAAYLKDRREEVVQAFQNVESTGRSFALTVLSKDPERNREAILAYAKDSAKTVRETLIEILSQQKGWEEDVIKLLSSKKGADREIAVRVLAKWDGEKYMPMLAKILEKEKNGKVRTLIENIMNMGGENSNAALTQEDLVKELHKGGKKRSLAWAYETPFSTVHRKDGAIAQEDYLQAIFLCYSTMTALGVNQSAATLAAALDEKEFAVYANELFDKWMEEGAEAKKRWVLYAAAIHGGAEIVNKLNRQIQEWPQASRGAIASDAVQALALNPLPQALLIVDGIARKFKFKQVKAAAAKALEFAAKQLGITTEELADRIVPNLGFDENMERVFDYGERSFTVTITPALEIEVFDEKKKKLKSLPAPGKKDDPAKAAAAYEEFKLMKKQLKTTVGSQKMRLEMALSTEREWSVQAWKELFVKNPIMHQFAIGLIWGVYENRKLTETFRYMEDGSFNTEEEDEFALPGEEEKGKMIGLVHPIDLSEESKSAWKEQLADYEIVQPIEQLDRPVYQRTKEEEDKKDLERFGGCLINDLSLSGKLLGMGWYRGEILDAGGFYTYYREDKEQNLGAELHFSGGYVGGGLDAEDVTIYEIRFYSVNGEMPEGYVKSGKKDSRKDRYWYFRQEDSKTYFLKDVPERYFSEIVLQLTKALAASKEKNENWKESRDRN